MTIDDMNIGKAATIVRLFDSGAVSRRMADMGFVPGQVVRIIGVAPLGDTLNIQVMGYNVAIRRSEARLVEVNL